MLKPYEVLTRCQLELKRSNLFTIDKLEIEMNILRAKRIIIDCKLGENSTSTDDIEQVIKDIYDKICQLNSNVGKTGDVKEIISRLHNLVDNMGKP